MPFGVGRARHLDKFIPRDEVGHRVFVHGWKGTVNKGVNFLGPDPRPNAPLYGILAKNHVKRLRAWARRLQVNLGPFTKRCFRNVMQSKRPLDYDRFESAKTYLARCERERAAAQAAGQPWPPKRPARVFGQRIQASTPSAVPPASAPSALPPVSITMTAKGPSLALAMERRAR